MAEITQEEFEKLKQELEEVVNITEGDSMVNSVMTLLNLPEEDFLVLYPGVLQSFQQSLNNANDKMLLVQSCNAAGITAEDLQQSLEGIEEALNTTTLSMAKKDFLKGIVFSLINAVIDTEGIAKKLVAVPFELCHENAKIPQYAHLSDSGMDVYALEDVTIHPGETVLVPTGIKVALPPGYELQVRPKSGRALKTKMRVANSPGTIDQGYRDEIGVIIDNIEPPIKDISYTFDDNGEIHITSIEHGRDMFIGKGEKFCQLVLAEVVKAAPYVVDSVKDIGEDRNGGFGSTGLK